MIEIQDEALNVLLLEDNDLEAVLVQQTLNSGWNAAVSIHRHLKVQDIVTYLSHKTPDIVLLDLHVLDSDGLDTVKRAVAGNHAKVPIVVTTSVKDKTMAIKALEMGIQDYIVKGEYSAESLANTIRFAKARALSNDSSPNISSTQLNLDGLAIDLASQSIVYNDGQERHILDLTPMELKLAAYFMKNVDQELSREELRKKIWGQNVAISDRVIDNQVSRLRTKIKISNYHIQSIRSFGYRFKKVS